MALAKARYPCRSGLLIASRDEGDPDFFLVTVRMHHHVAHEPYYDATLPPEMTQSIWETLGWRKHSPSPNLDAGEAASSDSESDANEDPSSDEEPTDLPQSIEDSIDPAPESIPPAAPPLEPEVYQQRMRRHISMIRDFCDGLEYQLPFNDYRMLDVLESEGAQFLRLVEDCLEKEGRLKETAEVSPDASQEEPHAIGENMEGVLATEVEKNLDKEADGDPSMARGEVLEGDGVEVLSTPERDDSPEGNWQQRHAPVSEGSSPHSSPNPGS